MAKTKVKASEQTKTITVLLGDNFTKKKKPAVQVCSDFDDFCTLPCNRAGPGFDVVASSFHLEATTTTMVL